MNQTILISVRFHDGRYHGAGDWPPSPARLFQALVAASPKSNDALERTSRAALAWLEQLDAPVIAAPRMHEGQHVSLFVPNNDLDAKGGDIRRIAEVRSATKHIRPRLFDSSIPLIYAWRVDAENDDQQHAESVCRIADGLYQLGRGIDMAWAIAEVLSEAEAEHRLAEYQGLIYRPSDKGEGTALNCPERGSLESLEIRNKAGAQRFNRVQSGRTVRTEFSNAPKPRFRSVAYNSPAIHLLFDLRRTTDAGSPFAPWPLKGTAALVQKLRDGAVAKLTQQSLSGHFDAALVSKVLVGRDATESDKGRRLRIVPLPSIGHPQVNRGIRRVLVIVPPDCPIRADDVAWAFAGLEIQAPAVDKDTGELLSSPVELVRSGDESMLKYYGMGDKGLSSHLWRSVTPLALPDSTKRRRIDPEKLKEEAKNGSERQREHHSAMHGVAQALRHAGLRQRIANLRVQREPFEAKGERAEAFADGTRFSKHQLWHVEIEFTEPLSGPVVLGNGRYCGLGLMAPVRKTEGIYAFAIVDGLAEHAAPLELARALRRAVMTRVQDALEKGQKLPLFFTGHEVDGAPARGGSHAHLAFVPDLDRQRLLIIAPHVIEHREPSHDERQHLAVLARALTGMETLCAGRSGKLSLTSGAVDVDSDPLFAASTTWIAQTPYVATRHAKRNVADSLQKDVLTEVQRRGLPAPSGIQQRDCASDVLSLRFAVAVSGPILLGKTLHYGGGLFAADTPAFLP